MIQAAVKNSMQWFCYFLIFKNNLGKGERFFESILIGHIVGAWEFTASFREVDKEYESIIQSFHIQ